MSPIDKKGEQEHRIINDQEVHKDYHQFKEFENFAWITFKNISAAAEKT